MRMLAAMRAHARMRYLPFSIFKPIHRWTFLDQQLCLKYSRTHGKNRTARSGRRTMLGRFVTMKLLARLFLILGVAFIGYGLARWWIVPDILAKQHAAFQQFITAHKAEIDANFLYPTNLPIKLDFYQLQKRVMRSGGFYPGFTQAVEPCAFGLMLIAVSYYFSQKKKDVRNDPSA